MNKEKCGAIVLGGHVQALGIVRAIGRMGYPVVVVEDTKKNIARHSKYCVQDFVVGNRELSHFITYLSKNADYHGWVIFPTNDYHVELLSRNADRLNGILNTTDSWDIIEKCYNKKLTYSIASSVEIPVPETYYPLDADDALECVRKIGYPLIIKPAIMHTFYKVFKKKVFKCYNDSEFLSYYDHAINVIPKNEILIQEIIPGDSSNQYSVGVLYDRDHSLVTLTARRKRQHPIDFGNATTFAETVNIPELKEYADRILSTIKYKGICEVEYKYDHRDDKYKLLEINARTWKWHSIAEKAGTPFIETYFNMLTGQNYTEHLKWKDSSWQHVTTDIPVIINMILRGYSTRNSKYPKVHAVIDKNDPLPFIYELAYLPFLVKNR